MSVEKFLYSPVFPFHINQYFGEDKACVSNADNKTVVSKETAALCPAGFRSLYTQTKGHNGLDLMASRWQPVYAAHDGVVNEVQTEVERGLGVGIVSDEERYFSEADAKCRYKTRYWHFISLDVHIGDKVKTGTFIGYADSTGYSSGDHLHFELKPVTVVMLNGLPLCTNVLQSNGMLGAVDPLPYLETGISALQISGIIKQIAEVSARIADFIADKLRRK